MGKFKTVSYPLQRPWPPQPSPGTMQAIPDQISARTDERYKLGRRMGRATHSAFAHAWLVLRLTTTAPADLRIPKTRIR